MEDKATTLSENERLELEILRIIADDDLSDEQKASQLLELFKTKLSKDND